MAEEFGKDDNEVQINDNSIVDTWTEIMDGYRKIHAKKDSEENELESISQESEEKSKSEDVEIKDTRN
ncbi:unnamed protein product [Wickerhamomyces anomalus]